MENEKPSEMSLRVAPVLTAVVRATEFKLALVNFAKDMVAPDANPTLLYDELRRIEQEFDRAYNAEKQEVIARLVGMTTDKPLTTPKIDEWVAAQTMRHARQRMSERRKNR